MNRDEFIKSNAILLSPPLIPEIKLYLASQVLPLWSATEKQLAQIGLPPPYWAFAWVGGQALARYILDHPDITRGKRVLDVGAGSGLVSLAASKAGAASVLAADIDPFACTAIRLNAAVNGADIAVTQQDVIGTMGNWDLILIGDLFYERPLADRLIAWIRACKAAILLGDPGRNYFPEKGVERRASYLIETLCDLEDRPIREAAVYQFVR